MEPSGSTLRRHGERYLRQFRERVVAAYHSNHSFVVTAREFGVHPTTVTQWVKESGPPPSPPSSPPAEEEYSAEEQLRTFLEPLCAGDSRIDKAVLLARALEALERSPAGPKSWLKLWVSRLDSSRPADKAHATYPPWFKSAVCMYATKFGQGHAVEVFSLSRKGVYDWLQGRSLTTRPRGGKEGKKVAEPSVDQALAVWARERFGEGRVDGAEVRQKAREMFSAAGREVACSQGWLAKWCRRHGMQQTPRASLDQGLEYRLLEWTLTRFDRHESVNHAELREQAGVLGRSARDDPTFTVSASWVVRFCRRHSALLQQGSDVRDELFPPDMRQAAQQFRTSLENMFFLGCMDELPVTFPSTLQGVELSRESGAPPLLLPRCPAARSHCSLLVAALEDGRVLPPGLLLKEGTEEALQCPEVAQGLVYVVQQPSQGDLDPGGLRRWVDELWFRHVAVPHALVVDCLASHEELEVRRAMAQVSCHLAVMPQGCAALLQPLHRGGLATWILNGIQERWSAHVACRPPAERPLAPEPALLVQWLAQLHVEAQEKPQQELVLEGFKSAGLRTKPIFPPP